MINGEAHLFLILICYLITIIGKAFSFIETIVPAEPKLSLLYRVIRVAFL